MDNTQRFLIESITSEIVNYIVEDANVDLETAFKRFYSSNLATLLENTTNGLYRDSSAYLYEKYYRNIGE
jgi:hypothetical protein